MSSALDQPSTTLLDDEAFLGTFRPSFASFIQRTVIISLITAVIFGPLLGVEPKFWLPIMLLTFVFSAFIFNDFETWQDNRNTQWHLTSLRLIYENDSNPEHNTAVNLADIHATHRALWKNLRLDLESGQSAMMLFLANPRAVELEIDKARQALMGQIADPPPPEDTTR